MNTIWEAWPNATHYHEDSDCFYMLQEGEWYILYCDGTCDKSESLYNGETDPTTLIAKELV